MKKSEDIWIHQAEKLALKSLPEDVPVAALIVDPTGNIIGEGYNRREKDQDPTAHAEIIALREAGQRVKNWRLNECTLYVTLEPCPMCASAIIQARIFAVVFGAYDPIQGGSLFNMAELYGSPVSILGGIREESCREQLQKFFKSHRAC